MKMTRKEKIQELRQQGKTYRVIGKLLKISGQRVYQILNYIPKIKNPADLKIMTKAKRIYLGLPADLTIKDGGRDLTREIVRQRDNCTCQICNKVWVAGKRRFDVHHLDEKISGKIDTRLVPLKYDRENMDKLITLCHKCHLNLHYGNVSLVDKLNPISK